MKMIKLKCDQCGASLEVNSELNEILCNYCGNKILIDDEATKLSRMEDAKLKAKKKNYEFEKEVQNEKDEKKKQAEKEDLKFMVYAYKGIFIALALFTALEAPMTPKILCIVQILLMGLSLLIDLKKIEEPFKGFNYILVGIALVLITIVFPMVAE